MIDPKSLKDYPLGTRLWSPYEMVRVGLILILVTTGIKTTTSICDSSLTMKRLTSAAVHLLWTNKRGN